MLTSEMKAILGRALADGWVMEPEAKRLFSLAGLRVPRFSWARTEEEAAASARRIGYPVAVKVVSPAIIHKSERGGVAVPVVDEALLRDIFVRFSHMEGFQGVVVDEMVTGIEVIVGATVDAQFGPVVLFGIGGTAVEIYRDVVLRMAPLDEAQADTMARCLKGYRLLEGYRGKKGVNGMELRNMLVSFSHLALDLEPFVESIDLNPVMCSPEACIIADARIMLKEGAGIGA